MDDTFQMDGAVAGLLREPRRLGQQVSTENEYDEQTHAFHNDVVNKISLLSQRTITGVIVSMRFSFAAGQEKIRRNCVS